MKKLLISLLLLIATSLQAIEVVELRTDGLVNPIGIGNNTPKFGWMIKSAKENIMQTAYRIVVATTSEILSQNKGDLWDSGKIISSESQWIEYKGIPLKSNTRAWWKVESFSNNDGSAWSATASFGIGLLKESNWRGQWIGLDSTAPGDSDTQWSRLSARYLRKNFNLTKKVKCATAHIAGMGMYELFINGTLVGEQVLAPVPTDYRKSITYNSFDVTNLLNESTNAIGVTLGNGRFYTMRQNYKPYKITNFGYPKLRLNLIVEYADGKRETIVSDQSWKLTTNGPIRSNNEYDGEEYDANKELGAWSSSNYDDSLWQQAQRVSIPTGTLRGAMTPNMKVLKTIPIVSINKKGGKYILDMGQNMAGWIKMKIRNAQKGDSIKLRFAELLNDDGSIYVENLRDAKVTDVYISNGKDNGQVWSPRFVYHGFRYVEVSGYNAPEKNDFIGEAVSDEMNIIGSFKSSNETLNKIYNCAWWGIFDNYKGMPVDCPQRDERQPWLGDRTMGCWGESFLFDNSRLYSKWAIDIEEAQRSDGSIPDVAPAYWNYYSDNMTWPTALPMVCDMLYTQFGDKASIQRHYEAIKKWMQYMREEYMNDEMVVTKDRYGDWCVPPESAELIHSKDPARITDGALISTAYYIKVLQMMSRFADILGNKEEKMQWEELENIMKSAFNKKYLVVKKRSSLAFGNVNSTDTIYYGNNTVTANVLPLAFGIVPEECVKAVSDNLITTIITKNSGAISCGVIGVQWLLKELSARGRADVAFMLATNTKYPSWGYMVEHGATTIWELWNGDTANPAMNSGNHVMLIGDLISFCYNNLAGIQTSRKIGETAFKHIILKPQFDIPDLKNIDASYNSPYGKVISRWTKIKNKLEWDIEIPANTTAEIHLPNGKVEKRGSGSYHFRIKIR